MSKKIIRSGFLTKVESDEIIETETATDQLKYLVNNGDAAIIMSGSYGALAELSTSIQNKKLGEHNKPIFIININGYFDGILRLLKNFIVINLIYVIEASYILLLMRQMI